MPSLAILPDFIKNSFKTKQKIIHILIAHFSQGLCYGIIQTLAHFRVSFLITDPSSFLKADVNYLRKQLRRVEDDMKRSQTDSSKYYTLLKEVYAKVHPVVNAPTSPTPSAKVEEAEDQTVNGKSETKG